MDTIKAKVLLVDDEDDFIDSLSKRLAVRGLRVSATTGGQDAVDLLDREKFDIIVLDLAMPGMDGLETLQQIKGKDPDAEIVMLSGHGNVKSTTEAMKHGATDFLEKPVDLPELLEKIAEAREKRILVMQKQAKKEIEEILQSKAW